MNDEKENLLAEDATPFQDKQAVALRYDAEEDEAPRVMAKGKGHVAEKILETARKNAIPVYQNKSLVTLLMALDIDKEIPPELYTTVAEILAYVYRVDESSRKKQEDLEKTRRK